MPEPIEITVGPYTVNIDYFGQIKVRLAELAGELTVPRNDGTHALIAALARELAQARRDSERLDWLQENWKLTGFIAEGEFRLSQLRTDIDEAIAAQQPAREEA